MSDKNVTNYNGGIGFGSLLAALFIGLKLGHIIAWPWLWVLSPLWIPLVVVLGLVATALLISLLVVLIKAATEY